jgi:acetylornithine deacetylase
MKGGLAANAAVMCALKKAGIRTGGDILFESAVDEEWVEVAGRLPHVSAKAAPMPASFRRERNWLSTGQPGVDSW